MNPFVAWAVSWQGTAALMSCALACGMILGWLHRDSRDRRRARAAEIERMGTLVAAGFRAMRARQEPPEVHHQDPRVAHEAWLVHADQALALVRDDLTDSAYTADMAARMDRFLESLARVPYSADELWSGQ